MKYALVSPVCNSNDRCEGLLTNLLDSIVWGGYSDKCPVVICWEPDCSEDYRASFEEKYPFITSLRPEGDFNLNFTKNSNRGLKYVHKELPDCGGLVLCNMDLTLPSAVYLEKIFNAGISSPTAEHIDGSAWAKVQFLNQKNSPGCPCNKTISQGTPTDSRKFAFFCTWIHRDVIDRIGHLDSTTFTSSFEDDDYVIRAILAGFPSQQSPVRIHHELKNRDASRGEPISTTNSYTVNDLGVSGYKFIEKWKLPFGLDKHS